jgi:hypothetical protein
VHDRRIGVRTPAREVFLFAIAFVSVEESTQPTVQWVQAALSWGVMLSSYFRLAPKFQDDVKAKSRNGLLCLYLGHLLSACASAAAKLVCRSLQVLSGYLDDKDEC